MASNLHWLRAMPDLALHHFADAKDIGSALAAELDIRAHEVAVHVFPDGESLVRVEASAVTQEVILLRRIDDPNAKLVELLLAADALRGSGARRITLVAPYLPYMRQDTRFAPGESASQQVLAGVLGAAFDRVLTLEAHLHRTRHLEDVFPIAAESLSAAPVLAAWCRRQAGRALLVGPDDESRAWVGRVAVAADLPFVVGRKARRGDRDVTVEFAAEALAALPPATPTSRAVIVDDIASSGATLASAARELRRLGVARVDAAVVHAIFGEGALADIEAAGVERVVSCDTVAHATNAIATASLFAEALAAGGS